MTTNQKHIELLDLSTFIDCVVPGKSNMSGQQEAQERRDFFIANLSDIYPDGLLETPYLYDFFTIYFVRVGTIHKINQLKSFEIKSNQIFISKPGEIKTWQRLEGVEGYMLAFTLDYLLLFVDDKGFIDTFDYLLPNAQRRFGLNEAQMAFFGTVFGEMEKEFKKPKKHSDELIKFWIFVILIKANRMYAEQYEKDFLSGYKNSAQQVYARFLIALERAFKKLAQGEIPRPPRVSEFADGLSINPTYLGECVRKASGKSTKAIINKRILLLAKCQLLHTHNNIAEIGYQLGFESSAYFIRFFKKFEQVTPLEYRKRNSGTFSITN